MKDQYKKLFESEVDLRDQDHIVKDEINKNKKDFDILLQQPETVPPQSNIELSLPEEEFHQPETDLKNSEDKSPLIESESHHQDILVPQPSLVDMEVDIAQIQVEISSPSEPLSPKEESKIPLSEAKEEVEEISKSNDDMEVDKVHEAPEVLKPDHDSIESWIKSLIDEILDFVVERKELVNTLEQQKKKWIMWGKKKAKEALEKASKRKTWNIQNKSVSAKTALEDVFREYEENSWRKKELTFNLLEDDEGEEAKVTKKDYLNDNLIEEVMVPLNLAIFQWLHIPIINQAKIINRAFIHLVFRKLELIKHFENWRKILFWGQGDVISNFTDLIFKRDPDSSIKDPRQINNCFDMAIKLSISDTNPLKELFYFTSKTNQVFGISAFNIEEHFKIHYKVSYPLTLIFDEENMIKYNKIFFFLIRIRRINDLLKIIWDFTNSVELRRSTFEVYTKIRKLQLLRQKMQQFVTNLIQYIHYNSSYSQDFIWK